MLASTDNSKSLSANNSLDDTENESKHTLRDKNFSQTQSEHPEVDSTTAPPTQQSKPQTTQALTTTTQLPPLSLTLPNQSELLPIAEEKDSPSSSSKAENESEANN